MRLALRLRSGQAFSRGSIALAALIVVCAAIFAYLSVARHYAFHTAAYDLAMYDQAVWNTSQGRWFEINLLEDSMPGLTNKLGDHVEPILLPLALLYRVRSNPDILLIVQASALAAVIWPLFHLIRWKTASAFLAGLGVVLYLAHPALWNALLFDFHPVTLAAAFLVFALWMLIQGRRAACLLFLVLAMACKEHVGLIVAMLGIYAVLFYKPERRLSIALVAIGLTGSILAFAVVIPAFQPSGASYYLNRYGRLGSTVGEILLAPITRPDVVWSILSRPNRVSYYGDLLLPLGGLPLLGVELILPVLPDIALNTFSAFGPARTLDYHYGVMIAPFLILATAWGIDRLGRWLSRLTSAKRKDIERLSENSVEAAATPPNGRAWEPSPATFQAVPKASVRPGVLAVSDPPHHTSGASANFVRAIRATNPCPIVWFAGAWLVISMAGYHLGHYGAFLPLSDRYLPTYTAEPRVAAGLRMAGQIPAGAVVSAQFNLVPHISQRPRAHIFPRIDDAGYVFLDTQGVIEPFANQSEYLAAVESLHRDQAFKVIAEQDGFILLRRR